MNKVNSVEFKNHQNIELDLDLISDDYDDSRPFYTVITGENGSYKSVILKKIAENAMLDEHEISTNSHDVFFNIKNPDDFKVIAYSGASIDRYPLIKARSKFASNFNCYTYLGQKAGANIVSRRQPFETMLTEAFFGEKILRMKDFFFKKAFSQIKLQPKITFILSPNKAFNRNSAFGSLYDLLRYSSSEYKDKSIRRGLYDTDLAKYLINQYRESEFKELEVNYQRKFKIDFSEDGISKLGPDSMRMIRLGLLVDLFRISSAEVTSLKTGEDFSLYDLSTGEFNMLTSILGLGFSVEHNAIVLIDEPEVSLHPQWQVEFISIINGIFNDYKVSHVIISTHSPLIVSSITDNCLIIDLSRDGEPSEEKNSLYGASTDEILINQFGLATGRNFFVMDLLQQAVNLIEDDKENTAEFMQLIPELNKIQNALSDNDPMIEVIKTVVSYAN